MASNKEPVAESVQNFHMLLYNLKYNFNSNLLSSSDFIAPQINIQVKMALTH
jgi:hypothetical protein